MYKLVKYLGVLLVDECGEENHLIGDVLWVNKGDYCSNKCKRGHDNTMHAMCL